MDYNYKSDVFCLIFILYLATGLTSSRGANNSSIGVCYGTSGDKLPSPEEVVSMYKFYGIARMRLDDPKKSVLDAVRHSGIQVLFVIGNHNIDHLASSYSASKLWIEKHVIVYWPDVQFRYIVVGEHAIWMYSNNALKAMKNLHKALFEVGLDQQIMISTIVGISVIETFRPPSAGVFTKEINSLMTRIVHFLDKIGSPLLAEVFPFYSAKNKIIPLDYTLFRSDEGVIMDGDLKYTNLFDEMVDALHVAIRRAGAYRVFVVVAATGWPTDGYDKTFACPENAQIYNSNLIKHVLSSHGTPQQRRSIETYLYTMFNDQNTNYYKEAHWGLFYPNKRQFIPLSLVS